MRSRGSRHGDSNGNAPARESNGGSVSRFHHCSRGFTGCMFYLCCILGLPCVSCGYGSEQPAEFLKWFTGSSLAIQELKFKITHSSNVGTQLQTSVHYYRVRWQTNAFFLQQEDSLADLNRKRLCGV